jgi:hypothetical protein
MEEVFIEFLDQMYWEGYGDAFKEDNPVHFNKQLRAFKKQHQIQKHEKVSLIYHNSPRGRKYS